MDTKGFIKRIVPFIGAFSLGLFIASFFVTIGGGRFGNRHRGMNREYKRQIRVEMEQLRQENFELKSQIRELQQDLPAVSTDADLRSMEELPLGHVPPPATYHVHR
ncbi:MAG: hypothetical protein IPI76_13355 [Chloracidobacterium sp.]|nr:hypothetical protein [Chloracidobacterium sp.]